MKKLGFALGALAGIAINMANAREARAYELNELAIRLANQHHFNDALNYLFEANELMPNNEIILNNIQLCRRALYKSQNEVREQNNYHSKKIDKPYNPYDIPKNDLYPKLDLIPNKDLFILFEIKHMNFSSKKDFIHHVKYYWSEEDVIKFINDYESLKDDFPKLRKNYDEKIRLEQEKINLEKEKFTLEQKFKPIIEDNYEDICRIYSIPKLGKKYVLNRVMEKHPIDQVKMDLNKYKQ